MNDRGEKLNDHLEIRLLDGLEIRLNDELVADFASNKAKALVAYLACNPGPCNRESLANMLWDTSGQDRAMGNLRVVINSIRKQLLPFVEITRQTIELTVNANVTIDSVDLEATLSAFCGSHDQRPTLDTADVSPLTEALTLYRGEFLANFYVRKARQFEAWVTFERERLQHRVARCMEALIDHYIASEQYTEGILWARKLVQLEPLYERGHQQLLILLAADNQRNAAIAHFSVYRQILADEYGVDPSPEIFALYERLISGGSLRHTSGEETRRPLDVLQLTDRGESTLPVVLASMIGRDGEMAELLALLQQPDCRLLTLIGPGGVGKTRLATAVAHAILEEREPTLFKDGVCFVPLEKIDEPTLIATAVAEALNLSLVEERSVILQVKNYLRRRHILFVLDNIEHLLDGVDILLDILQGAPHVKLLTTSRERLGYLGEHLFEVAGLSFPRTLTSRPVTKIDVDHPVNVPDKEKLATMYSAVQLFAREAAAQKTAFELNDEYDAVAAICREVEGLPLAIQLAAASVRAFSAAQILTRIRQNIDFLQSTMRNMPPRHRSLRAVFESAWQQLSEADQNAFRQLSVFAGSFVPDAAEQVAGVTTQLLFTLVNSSLIEQVKSGSQGTIRYKIHAVLRQYAQEKLANEPSVLRATHGRHAAYYVTFLEEYEAIGESRAADALASIAAEIENCRAAWQWAVLHNRLHWAERALPALGNYYLLHGPFQEGSNVILAAIEELERRRRQEPGNDDAHSPFLAALLAVQARLYIRQAAYDDAVQAGLATIDLSTGHEGLAARVEGQLAAAQGYRYQGNFTEAQHHAEQALNLAVARESKPAIAKSLLVLGTVWLYESKYESANTALTDALAIYRELGNAQNESQTLIVLGSLCLYQGDYSSARSHFEHSLQRFQRVGDRQGQAQALNNLGAVHFHIGNSQESLDNYHQALSIEQETGGMNGISLLHSNLSLLCQHMDDFEAGLRYGESAESIAQELGARDSRAFALLCIGHARTGKHQWEEAKRAYAHALRLRRDLGQENQALEPWAGLIRVATALDLDGSVLDDVDKILKKMCGNNLVGIVEPFRIYWSCYLALRHHDDGRADETLEQAYNLLRERTEAISSSLQRHSYIYNRPARRAIMEEYLRQARSPSTDQEPPA